MRKSFRCKAFFSGIIVLVTVTTAHADDRADKTYLDLVDQAEHAPGKKVLISRYCAEHMLPRVITRDTTLI